MRRLMALLIAVALLTGMLYSPLAVQAAELGTGHPDSWRISDRMANYPPRRGTITSPDGFRQVLAKQPGDTSRVALFASSDLWAGDEANPAEFVPKHFKDFDLILLGSGGTTSYLHAVNLAALADQLPGRRAVLHLSPQWFAPTGITGPGLPKRVHLDMWDAMLANPMVSAETKTKITQRAYSLNPVLCEQYGYCPPAVSTKPGLRQAVFLPARAIERRMTALTDRHKETKFLTLFNTGYQYTESARTPDAQFWADAEAELVQLAQSRCTNSFYVDDDYYQEVIEPAIAKYAGTETELSYAESPEYDDLRLFLTVAKETNIEVLLLLTPENGFWTDISGMPKAGRTAYYNNIRQLAAETGSRLVDLSDHEKDPFFFSDRTHLGMKGWIHVIRASYEFAKSD